MDGFFDNFDMLNSLRGVGMNPDSIAPQDRNAARMMVLSAMGSQMAGGTPFFDSLSSIGDRADARQMKQLQMMEMLGKIQEQKNLFAAQGDVSRMAANVGGPAQAQGTPPAGSPAGGAPMTGTPAAAASVGTPDGGAPTPTQAAGATPGANTAPSNKVYAEMYRNAARRYLGVKGGAEIAKQFEEIANKYDPPEEYGTEPRTVMGPNGPMLALFGKNGTMKPVDGVSPTPKLTAPVATANGMVTMDEHTGGVQPLTMGGQPVMPHEAAPAEQKLYEFAKSQGYKGSLNDFMIAQRRAGAASMNVKVGNTLGQDVAAGIAKGVMTNQTQAAAAADQLQNIAQIRTALSDGAITGPLANVRMMGARVMGQFGGSSESLQKLQATAAAVQAMAKSNVTAAQALNGQGQISDGERVLIEKASNGKQEMTGAELQAVTEANEKVARLTLDGYNRQVQALKKIPGMEQLAPFYEATMPGGSIESAKAGAPGVPGSKVSAGGTVLQPKPLPQFKGVLTQPQQQQGAPSTATAGGAPDLRTMAAQELERRRRAAAGGR